ncbi:MAG: hypothetical protein FJ100_22685 [Deltaproteobacteria bacterium]|nr:hypothetical protein [Deltaproteobacteria bacterium]
MVAWCAAVWLFGCTDASPPAAADAKADAGSADGATVPGGWADLPIQPAGQPATPQEEAAWLKRIESGEDFVDVRLKAGVQIAPQSAANAATVKPGELRFPVQGNGWVGTLKTGAPLVVPPTASEAERKKAGGNNLLGAMVRVQGVTQVGAQWVVATVPAAIQDVLVGAVSISHFPEGYKERTLPDDVSLTDLVVGLDPSPMAKGLLEGRRGGLSWGDLNPVKLYEKGKKIVNDVID